MQLHSTNGPFFTTQRNCPVLRKKTAIEKATTETIEVEKSSLVVAMEEKLCSFWQKQQVLFPNIMKHSYQYLAEVNSY